MLNRMLTVAIASESEAETCHYFGSCTCSCKQVHQRSLSVSIKRPSVKLCAFYAPGGTFKVGTSICWWIVQWSQMDTKQQHTLIHWLCVQTLAGEFFFDCPLLFVKITSSNGSFKSNQQELSIQISVCWIF